MAEPAFVHLRIHSDFCMVDGLANVKGLVKKAKALNMPALAITDQGNLCGLVRYFGAAMGEGLKPLVGADLDVMEQDTERMRPGRPWCFANLRSGEGLDKVEAFLLQQLPEGPRVSTPSAARANPHIG